MDEELAETVDVNFGCVLPRLQMISVHRFLRSLEVGATKVAGISQVVIDGAQVARLCFKNEEMAEAFLSKYGGLSQHEIERRRLEVVIKSPETREKFIRIADFPVNGKIGILENKLGELGKILTLRRDIYKASGNQDYIECYNGFITVRMILTKEIPSYALAGRYRVHIRYSGQAYTCRVCNQPGHVGANCPNRVKEPPMGQKQLLDPKQREPTEKAGQKEHTRETPPIMNTTNFPPLKEARKAASQTRSETKGKEIDKASAVKETKTHIENEHITNTLVTNVEPGPSETEANSSMEKWLTLSSPFVCRFATISSTDFSILWKTRMMSREATTQYRTP